MARARARGTSRRWPGEPKILRVLCLVFKTPSKTPLGIPKCIPSQGMKTQPTCLYRFNKRLTLRCEKVLFFLRLFFQLSCKRIQLSLVQAIVIKGTTHNKLILNKLCTNEYNTPLCFIQQIVFVANGNKLYASIVITLLNKTRSVLTKNNAIVA